MSTEYGLIQRAASVVRPKRIGDSTMGDVGCALVAEDGEIYTGVCIDTPCGMGYCAEHNAIGTMITHGEYRIRTIVAVWVDQEGKTHVIPPCGRCREFMKQVHPDNLEADVILAKNKVVKLKELLPHHVWCDG